MTKLLTVFVSVLWLVAAVPAQHSALGSVRGRQLRQNPRSVGETATLARERTKAIKKALSILSLRGKDITATGTESEKKADETPSDPEPNTTNTDPTDPEPKDTTVESEEKSDTEENTALPTDGNGPSMEVEPEVFPNPGEPIPSAVDPAPPNPAELFPIEPLEEIQGQITDILDDMVAKEEAERAAAREVLKEKWIPIIMEKEDVIPSSGPSEAKEMLLAAAFDAVADVLLDLKDWED